MCGILGIISRRNHEPQFSRDDAIAMRDTMTARGPDECGIYQKANYTMAHRRLAIRDIADGKQPWVSADGRYVLVYNGEIYNDDQLRRELEERGYRFRTRCDTEVLLAAWITWGKACVRKLRGMFAFGVADVVADRWWVVRDRCGIKPLFYANIANEFVFASSINAIRRHPKFISRPDLATARHYLSTLRLTLDDRTIYEGIQTVRPAEIFSGSAGYIQKEIYWTPDAEELKDISYEEAVNNLEARLKDSVSARLKSDVPVGMMLSGGVDSNTIASMVVEDANSSVTGRCGGGVDPDENREQSDFQHAAKFANQFNFDYREVHVDQLAYRETWEDLLDSYATPLSTPTDVIIYKVALSLREQVGVALGGEGADEIFCGYDIPHWSGEDYDRSNALLGSSSANSEDARASLIRQYGRDRFFSASDHYLANNALIPRSSQLSLFNDRYWPAADHERLVERFYDNQFDSQPNRTMARKYAYVLFRQNLESLLGRLDSATMAASLEARVPYTDHLLVEAAFKIPHRYKISLSSDETQPWLSSLDLAQRGSLRGKKVLRSIAGRRLPKPFAERPKMSFPTPLAKWLGTDWTAWIKTKLQTSRFANEFFRKDALQELGQLPAGLAMWNWPILNLAMWGDRCL